MTQRLAASSATLFVEVTDGLVELTHVAAYLTLAPWVVLATEAGLIVVEDFLRRYSPSSRVIQPAFEGVSMTSTRPA